MNTESVIRTKQVEQFVYARNFRDLLVYERAFIVSRRIFNLSKDFPRIAEDGPLFDDTDVDDPLTPDW